MSHQQNIHWHSKIKSSCLLRPSSTRLRRRKRRCRAIMQSSKICPHNPNHVAQSMSLQLQDEPHSPLPALPFPAIHYLANTSTSSNMHEQFHLQMFWPTIFDPCGSMCNALAISRMTQRKFCKGKGKPPCLAYIFISLSTIWLVVLLILPLYFIYLEKDKGHL